MRFGHITRRSLWSLGPRRPDEYPAKDLRGCDGKHVDDREPLMLGEHEVGSWREGQHQVTCPACAVLMDAALEAAE
jgi:hypothetical protein